MGDCHSFDPGSKFGFRPNDNPGPGALTSFNISANITQKLQEGRDIRAIPPYQSGLYNSGFSPASSSPLVENHSLLVENKTTDGFKQYLIAQNKRNAKGIMIYAKKYCHVLQQNDVSELLTISVTKRHHAMEALTALSTYWGCYDQWKKLRERYQLKWEGKDGLDVFKAIIDKEHNYPSMLQWLKDVCRKIPEEYANILIFNTLTGLRPSEACQSISLIQTDLSNYMKKEEGVLEQWKYPDLFIRNSKKAFISLVDDNVIQIAMNANNCGYTALSSYLKRRGLKMRMGHCRKIFATYVRMNGVEQEIVDLLQGRIPKSVFARHYFRPDFKDRNDKIRLLINSLKKEIATL